MQSWYLFVAKVTIPVCSGVEREEMTLNFVKYTSFLSSIFTVGLADVALSLHVKLAISLSCKTPYCLHEYCAILEY